MEVFNFKNHRFDTGFPVKISDEGMVIGGKEEDQYLLWDRITGVNLLFGRKRRIGPFCVLTLAGEDGEVVLRSQDLNHAGQNGYRTFRNLLESMPLGRIIDRQGVAASVGSNEPIYIHIPLLIAATGIMLWVAWVRHAFLFFLVFLILVAFPTKMAWDMRRREGAEAVRTELERRMDLRVG